MTERSVEPASVEPAAVEAPPGPTDEPAGADKPAAAAAPVEADKPAAEGVAKEAPGEAERPVDHWEHFGPPPVTVPVWAAGPGQADTALLILDAAGWHRYDDDACNVTYRSPDGSVTAEFGPETERYHRRGPLWEVKYADPDPYAKSKRSWTATFDDDVPAEAIARFLAALADPAGLEIDRWT